MSVVGITMVRDEADIIEHTIRHMAGQVDKLIVANNLSEDGTTDILLMLADELGVIVVDDPDPRFVQSKKMSGLAAQARVMGAEWVVPFDADELWTAPNGTIAEFLIAQFPSVQVVNGEMWDHIATGLDDPDDPNPYTRIKYRARERYYMPKVAVRTHEKLVILPGNHAATHAKQSLRKSSESLNIRHFRYRSPEQMVSKIRNGYEAHRISGVPETIGHNYWRLGRQLENEGEEALRHEFATHHYVAVPGKTMVLDPAPFQPVFA